MIQSVLKAILYIFIFIISTIAVIAAEIRVIVIVSNVLSIFSGSTSMLVNGLALGAFILAVQGTALGVAFIVSYLLLGIFRWRQLVGKHSKWAPFVIAPLVPTVLCFSILAHSIYTLIKFPSPAPYPDSVVQEVNEYKRNNWFDKELVYKVGTPIEEVEQYYETEMSKYCAIGWGFEDAESMCNTAMACRSAECEISRPLAQDAQFFSVRLVLISDEQTEVYHIDRIGRFD
ncbi:MAG: hypothetical protein GY797_17265 [Deltaproteobacteria bacterium]|nr:hypothetical protein [Deltaproteobacteria bacterium]